MGEGLVIACAPSDPAIAAVRTHSLWKWRRSRRRPERGPRLIHRHGGDAVLLFAVEPKNSPLLLARGSRGPLRDHVIDHSAQGPSSTRSSPSTGVMMGDHPANNFVSMAAPFQRTRQGRCCRISSLESETAWAMASSRAASPSFRYS